MSATTMAKVMTNTTTTVLAKAVITCGNTSCHIEDKQMVTMMVKVMVPHGKLENGGESGGGSNSKNVCKSGGASDGEDDGAGLENQ